MSPVRPVALRDALLGRVEERMGADPSIWFLTADLGAPALDGMRRRFPDRCVNVGIAEQNLVEIATGLALEGSTVFAYGIAPFITMRAYEQVRINLAMLSRFREINVNLVSLGAGFSYDVSGPSHHCVEDVTLMRLLPNIDLFSPADCFTVEAFVDRAIASRRPKYLRLEGKPLPSIYGAGVDVDFRRGFTPLRTGEGVCLVATGFTTHKALRIADILEREGIRLGVIDLFMMRPFDEAALAASLARYPHVFTIEESFIHRGGLDSAVSGVIERLAVPTRLRRYGLDDRYLFENGGRELLHRVSGMDDETIAEDVRKRA